MVFNIDPMENEMIEHAATGYFDIAYEEGWMRFKLKHQCTDSCEELLNKFWNQIRPNINIYKCVNDNPALLDMIQYIPSPEDLRRSREENPIVTTTPPRVQIKAFPEAYEEEAARKTIITLARKDVLEIKNTASSTISNHRSEDSQNVAARTAGSHSSRQRATEPTHSSVNPTLLSVGPLPGVVRSPLPNNTLLSVAPLPGVVISPLPNNSTAM